MDPRRGLLIGSLLAFPAPLAGQAAIAGVLREDSSKAAIAGAQVVVRALNRTVTTDTAGRYMMDGLPHGVHQVLVRAIGYQPILLRAYLVANDTLELELAMKKAVQELAPLEVTASAVPRGLEGFEDRRRMGFGTFIDWTRLRKEDHHRTSDLFYGMRGVRVQWDRTGRPYLVSTRGNCPMRLLFNGVPLGTRDIDLWSIDNLDAIEVYRGGADTPIEFGGTGGSCGTVILWSRRH